MPVNQERVYAEALALWKAVTTDPAPAIADGSRLLEVLLQTLEFKPYSRLCSPALRDSDVVWPR